MLREMFCFRPHETSWQHHFSLFFFLFSGEKIVQIVINRKKNMHRNCTSPIKAIIGEETSGSNAFNRTRSESYPVAPAYDK